MQCDGAVASAQYDAWPTRRDRFAGIARRQRKVPAGRTTQNETAPLIDHDCGDKIHGGTSHEPRHESIDRRIKHPRWRIVLLQQPTVHHCHAVGHGHRLQLVMSHIDDGGIQVLVEPLEFRPHLPAQLRIQIRQRLIHQECPRIAHQRAPQRHALLLAAGKLAWPALEQVFDIEYLGRRAHLHIDVGPRHLPHFKREGEILEHRLIRI